MNVIARLELKIPPVVLLLAFAAVMKISARFATVLSWRDRAHVAAMVIMASGVLVALLGVVSFRRQRTTVDPRCPRRTSALVTSGVYRVTRNPMYLGMLLALLGWAVWLGELAPFLFLPLFVAALTRWQILPEERALAQMFPQEFACYRTRVRRWI